MVKLKTLVPSRDDDDVESAGRFRREGAPAQLDENHEGRGVRLHSTRSVPRHLAEPQGGRSYDQGSGKICSFFLL